MGNELVKLDGSGQNWSTQIKDDALQYIRGNELKHFKRAPYIGWLIVIALVGIFRNPIISFFTGVGDAAWAVAYAAVSLGLLYTLGRIFASDAFRDGYLLMVDMVAGYWRDYWENKNPILAIQRTLKNLKADLMEGKKILADLVRQYVDLLVQTKDAMEEGQDFRDQSQIALENPKLVPRAMNAIDIPPEILELDEFNVLDENAGVDTEAFSMSRYTLANDADERVRHYKEQAREMADQILDLKTLLSAGEIRSTEMESSINSLIKDYNLNAKMAYAYNAVRSFLGGKRFDDLQRQAGIIRKRIDGYRAEILYTKQVTKGLVDDYRAGRAVKDYRTKRDYKEFIRASTVVSPENKAKLLGPGSTIDQITADEYMPRTSTEGIKVRKSGFDDLV